LQRHNRAQLAYATFGLLIVCAMIAGGFGVYAADFLFGGDRDVEEPLEGDNDELVDELRNRVEDDPTDAASMSLLAELLFYDGNLSESIAWFQRALDVEPDNTAIRLSFADILRQADKPNDAELQFLRVLAAEPNNYEAHYYLAELYRLGDPPRDDDAADHYYRVIEIAPDSYLAEQSAMHLAALGYATPTAGASPPADSPVASPAATEGSP
jgi:tetratricopeptide (TPR) repeat protein